MADNATVTVSHDVVTSVTAGSSATNSVAVSADVNISITLTYEAANTVTMTMFPLGG